jgi:hypothetical protein
MNMDKLKNFYDQTLSIPEKYKLIWSLDSKKSYWVKTSDDILKALRMNNSNMFFGVAMSDKNYGSGKRATSKQVSAITCLFLDIDIASGNKDVHSKNNLPQTIEDAMEIATRFLEPTFVVNSGHGLHAYYLLSEPINLIEERQYFASLLQQFQKAHRDAFPQYQIDYTHDLARVLRCPGSMNTKDPENPVPCEIIYENETTYWKEEVEDAIEYNSDLVFDAQLPFQKTEKTDPEKALTLSSTQDFVEWFDNQGLVLDPAASLDAETWVDLEQMSNGKLSKIYNHKSANEDDMSGYDMSLANLAEKNCLSDQHIIDLLVMHRRKYGVKLHKLSRKDYYARTLIKATADRLLENVRRKPAAPTSVVSKEPVKKNISATTPTTHTYYSGYSGTNKKVIRNYLTKLLGVEIKRIICYPKDPEPIFDIELADLPGKHIRLGTHKDGIANQKNFQSKICAYGLPMPKSVSADVWSPSVINDLRILTEEGKIPETATFSGQVSVWTREYLLAKDIQTEKAFKENDQAMPYMTECGTYVIFALGKFRQWLQLNKGSNLGFDLEYTMISHGFTTQGPLCKTPPNFIKTE